MSATKEVKIDFSNKHPKIDPHTGKPRIKGQQTPTAIDGLVKGVMPEIVGATIKCECHVCGYGGVRCPWYGYLLIVRTPANGKRSEEGGFVECPSCHKLSVSEMKDESGTVAKLTHEELEARNRLQEQEIAELKRQNEYMREKSGRTPPKKGAIIKEEAK